jgi:hypothetical protein
MTNDPNFAAKTLSQTVRALKARGAPKESRLRVIVIARVHARPRAGWPSGPIALLSVSGTSKHASTREVIKADASSVLNASSAWR